MKLMRISKSFKSGLFESVEFDENDGLLRVIVVEYPTINRIYFEGNVRVEDAALEKVLKSKEKYVLDAQTVEQDRKNIAETYAVMGRLAARVNPKVIRKPENRVDLIFEIFEGGVIEIEKIGIVGNRLFLTDGYVVFYPQNKPVFFEHS